MNIRNLAALSLAMLMTTIPLSAFAQTNVPSYAQPDGDVQIRGRVVSFDNGYNLTVRDDKGYVDNVRLHQGTIINPVGLHLEPGMTVSILGYNAGSAFAANEIDTPYVYYGGVPYYGGHPWFYYGPSVSLSFFFGNGGWWHGDGFTGPYHYYGGARVYDRAHIGAVYRGGYFRGRDYVVGHERGGYAPRGRSDRH